MLIQFALGYFFFQIPGGMLASRFGVRVVLPAIAVAWSTCALWGTLTATADGLRLSRIALGVAQAGLVPCCAKVVADWFPVARRGIGFEMRVLAHDMRPDAQAAAELGVTLCDLPTLLAEADVVTLHVSLDDRPGKFTETCQQAIGDGAWAGLRDQLARRE